MEIEYLNNDPKFTTLLTLNFGNTFRLFNSSASHRRYMKIQSTSPEFSTNFSSVINIENGERHTWANTTEVIRVYMKAVEYEPEKEKEV